MKCRLLSILIISAGAIMVAISPARAFGQSDPYEKRAPPPWLEDVPCKDDKERQIAGVAGVHEFRMCFQVPEEKLYARQDEVLVDLIVSVYAAKEAKNLGLTSVT